MIEARIDNRQFGAPAEATTFLETAFTTGDIEYGYIISAYSNTKWRYEIVCVDYDESAISPAQFLAKVDKDKTDIPLEHKWACPDFVALPQFVWFGRGEQANLIRAAVRIRPGFTQTGELPAPTRATARRTPAA